MKGMLSAASTLIDRSLVIGAVLLGLAILGGIFNFLRLGLYSVGVGRTRAGVISGVLMVLTAVFVYHKFSS